MNNQFKILFVDDDKDVLELFSGQLRAEGYIVDTFETVEAGIAALIKYSYAVSIINIEFINDPEGGIRIINHIKENNIETMPIILTGTGIPKNLKKVFSGVYDYIEKNDSASNNLLKRIKNAFDFKQSEKCRKEIEKKLTQSEIERRRIEEKYKDVQKQLNNLETKRNKVEDKFNERTIISKEKKTPMYQSAHTFEKCYNIPTRNLCYRIRQKVPLRYHEAHNLIDFIDHSIDLWANLFSMELNDPMTKIDLTNKALEDIEIFKWEDIKNDLEKFFEQYFVMNINDLFDHYTNENFYWGSDIVTLSDIYDKEFIWETFVDFNVIGDNDIMIKGVRSYFRAVLINLIANAVEAIDLYRIFKKSGERAQIHISCQQNEFQTIIMIKNTGKGMSHYRANLYNNIIFSIAKKGQLQLSDDLLENDNRDKIFTSKPGIGSGYSLIQAAYYFSRIERKQNNNKIERGYMKVDTITTETKFTITLPFGVQTNSELEKTYFRWHENYENQNCYSMKKISNFMQLDNYLSDCRELLNELEIKKGSCKREVLIIEDSRSDRFRMRMLIDNLNFQFRRFAWDANKKAVLTTETIVDLMKKTEPNILILDLAWTPKDEKIINDMLFQEIKNVKTIMDLDKPHSFILLYVIIDNPNIFGYLDIIIVLSHISPIFDGLKLFIQNNYFNKMNHKGIILQKWRDENKFRQALIENHRRMK